MKPLFERRLRRSAKGIIIFGMKLPHPIPYQGSKRNLASRILKYFPPHVETLYEPFAGSAAITIAAAHHGAAQRFVVSDLNGPLIALWQTIIETPDEIAKQYETLWLAQLGNERTYYDLVRSQFNTTGRPDYFLYLLARCVKAAVRYNTYGEFNQSPDNRRRGAQPSTMKYHIHGASQLLKGKTEVLAEDYRVVVQRASPNDLVYMDPPYQGVCGKRDPRYRDNVLFDEFVVTLEQLNTRAISYIVSYDGRTGSKAFGRSLPPHLQLDHIEVAAGRSSQATLLGREDETYESLYISPALTSRLQATAAQGERQVQQRMELRL